MLLSIEKMCLTLDLVTWLQQFLQNWTGFCTFTDFERLTPPVHNFVKVESLTVSVMSYQFDYLTKKTHPRIFPKLRPPPWGFSLLSPDPSPSGASPELSSSWSSSRWPDSVCRAERWTLSLTSLGKAISVKSFLLIKMNQDNYCVCLRYLLWGSVICM